MAEKKWIQDAIKHEGALTRKAKNAGMTPLAYARKHQDDKGTTGKQSRLALTLHELSKRKK